MTPLPSLLPFWPHFFLLPQLQLNWPPCFSLAMSVIPLPQESTRGYFCWTNIILGTHVVASTTLENFYSNVNLSVMPSSTIPFTFQFTPQNYFPLWFFYHFSLLTHNTVCFFYCQSSFTRASKQENIFVLLTAITFWIWSYPWHSMSARWIFHVGINKWELDIAISIKWHY